MRGTDDAGLAAGQDRAPARRGWAALLAGSLVVLVVVSLVGLAVLPPSALPKAVHAASSEVILRASDIPDVGWGVRASGTNGSGTWRLFSVHNELVLAFLNVSLWVEMDGVGASRAFSAIAGSTGYPTEGGQVAGADASLFWSDGSGSSAGMVVRRYNVVFILSAYLESSWDLTRSDLGTWAGWQLSRIEASAA